MWLLLFGSQLPSPHAGFLRSLEAYQVISMRRGNS
jgi:hypothetical protein